MKRILAISATLLITTGAYAQESVYVLGKTSFNANCAACHGEDAKGTGLTAQLFKVPPPSLTILASKNGGAFPFSEVYQTIASGMGERAHGDSNMPIWGVHFLRDVLEDRGVSKADAEHIVQGRILSLVYYLESIQE